MIVLASQSAARRTMLAAAGVVHEAVPAHVDEAGLTAGLLVEGASAERIADALAELKAVKISRKLPGVLVLGADTVVVAADGTLLSKPAMRSEAEAQLRQLSGRTHRLISAAVFAENGQPVWRACEAVRLEMRVLSDAYIGKYLDLEGKAVLGCVGCYRIEGLGAQLFHKVVGDQFTVRGLPLLAVLGYLRDRRVLAS